MSNMRDRRYSGRRTPSPHPPPPTRERGRRDYGDDNWRLPSSSYRAPPPGPQWAERDPLPPPTAAARLPAAFVPRRENEYHNVRSRNRPPPPRSRSRSPRWQPQRTPGHQYGRAVDDSVGRRREYNDDRLYSDERYVRREDKLPSIDEPVSRRELSGNFQLDNLMTGDENRPNRSRNLSPYRDVVVGSTNPFNRVSDSAERIVRDRPRTHYDYSMKPQVRDGRFSDWGSDKIIQGNGEEKPLVGNGGYIRPRRSARGRDDDEVEDDGLSYRRRTQLGEEYGREHTNGGLERNVGIIVPRGDELGRLQIHSPYDIRQPVYLQEDVGIHDPLRRNRSMEVEEGASRDPLDDDDDVDLGSGDMDWGYDDRDDELLMPEELRHGREGYGTNNNLQNPHFVPTGQMHHPRKHFKASKGNIGNRLGPGPAADSVKQRLGPRLVLPARSLKQGSSRAAASDVKQRLGPVLQPGKNSGEGRNAVKPPWLKVPNKGQQQRVSNETSSAKGSKSLAVKDKNTKTEPQENSEEFIQIVNNAFLKLTKSLNENSAIRRKYMAEQGGGTRVLRCSVCGSDSKDFPDTLSLAQHACTSQKAGSRAEHLGFHKALCLLMGWKCHIGDIIKGPWVRQKLTDDEASSMNDDLILWPPVVIIHNSSISSENRNKRIVVSIEDLRSVLKGKGFLDSITNICRGKAANHSVMVVSFAATFSGLQEAEKLHRHYSENKHGRSEFQRIGTTTTTSATNGDDDDDKRMVLEEGEVNDEAAEAVLYGFLGITSDLDKLDFEMKKRCVVKSKKEIDAIADATLEC